jgi:hypothetical protein
MEVACIAEAAISCKRSSVSDDIIPQKAAIILIATRLLFLAREKSVVEKEIKDACILA